MENTYYVGNNRNFEIWKDDHRVYSATNSEMFSMMVAIHFAEHLGSFVRVINDNDNDNVIMVFENYWFKIKK